MKYPDLHRKVRFVIPIAKRPRKGRCKSQAEVLMKPIYKRLYKAPKQGGLSNPLSKGLHEAPMYRATNIPLEAFTLVVGSSCMDVQCYLPFILYPLA